MSPWYSVPYPGRNAPCPCGSGLKTKGCCQSFFDRSPLDMDDRIGVFLTYKDLFPAARTTPSGLRTALSAYDGKQLLRLLAAISWYLGEALFSIDPHLELAF